MTLPKIDAESELVYFCLSERFRPDEFKELQQSLAPLLPERLGKIKAMATSYGLRFSSGEWNEERVVFVAALMAAQQLVRNMREQSDKLTSALREKIVGPIRSARGLLAKAIPSAPELSGLNEHAAWAEAWIDIDRAERHARWGLAPEPPRQGAPVNWQVQIRNFLTVAGLPEHAALRHAKAIMGRIAAIPSKK